MRTIDLGTGNYMSNPAGCFQMMDLGDSPFYFINNDGTISKTSNITRHVNVPLLTLNEWGKVTKRPLGPRITEQRNWVRLTATKQATQLEQERNLVLPPPSVKMYGFYYKGATAPFDYLLLDPKLCCYIKTANMAITRSDNITIYHFFLPECVQTLKDTSLIEDGEVITSFTGAEIFDNWLSMIYAACRTRGTFEKLINECKDVIGKHLEDKEMFRNFANKIRGEQDEK